MESHLPCPVCGTELTLKIVNPSDEEKIHPTRDQWAAAEEAALLREVEDANGR